MGVNRNKQSHKGKLCVSKMFNIVTEAMVQYCLAGLYNLEVTQHGIWYEESDMGVTIYDNFGIIAVAYHKWVQYIFGLILRAFKKEKLNTSRSKTTLVDYNL